MIRALFSGSGRPAHLDYGGPVRAAKCLANHAASVERTAIAKECADLRLDILRYLADTGRTQVAVAELAGVAYSTLIRLLSGGNVTPESRAKLRAFLPSH